MVSFNPEQRFIVTGASSGIGEGVALLLNELGATVVGIGRSQSRLDGMKAKAKCPENVFLEQKDLAEDIAGLPAYVKALKEKYGKFCGMAYCAGIAEVSPLQLWDYEKERRFFDVNYFAPLAMLKGMSDRRNNVAGKTSCVLIASASALLADKGHCSYAGSKAALVTSCRTLAKELTVQRLRVNTVSPTVIRTPMTTSEGGEYEQSQIAKYPMGFGEVSDVANLVVFLLSARAKWITGQNYVVDCASF